MDHPATGINTGTGLPTTPSPDRGHTSASDPVSRKGPNRETVQTLDFWVGLFGKDQPTSFTYSNRHASSMTLILEMTGTGKTPINIRMSGRLSDEATTSPPCSLVVLLWANDDLGVREAVGRDTTHLMKQPRPKRSPSHLPNIVITSVAGIRRISSDQLRVRTSK